MTLPTHDFTRPARLPPELKGRLAVWLHRANAIFSESMSGLGLTLQALSLDQNTARPLETLENWIGQPLGFRLNFMGRPTILALPNRLVQNLVAGLLGDAVSTDAADRELSAVEVNLCELVVKTFVSSLLEAWVDESALQLELGDREPNLRRSRTFRPSDPLVVCRSSVKVQESEQLWSWMVRMETLLDLFGTAAASSTAAPIAPQRQQMESMVRGMKVPLTVKLGQVQLSASQVAKLQVGDVVVLHQRTTEPLKGSISGKPAFLGWPGQIGGKQAFQIESDLSK